MRSGYRIVTLAALGGVALGLSVWAVGHVSAHCDTMGGPVITEAQAALESGEVTPVLKWVLPEREAEIRAAFEHAVAVRALGPSARELADRHFLETLVRVHRAGEGAPYTGITDDPVEPIVAMADRALAEGSADAMVDELAKRTAAAVRERFGRASEARAHRDESVEAGRAYVAAYVEYVHFVEGLHGLIAADGDHAHAAHAESGASDAAGHAAHSH